MEDRELLELAAKANWAREVADDEISLRYCEINDGILYLHADNQDHNGHDREFVWNPLADDGDALRLAVKLRMMLDDIRKGYQAGCVVAVTGDACCYEPRDPDPNAATRRVIVRAAAAIGKEV